MAGRRQGLWRGLVLPSILDRSTLKARFYEFNVWSERKRIEKLRSMHRNPVKRGLVTEPEHWRSSSYRFYRLNEPGPVQVNQGWKEISFRERVA